MAVESLGWKKKNIRNSLKQTLFLGCWDRRKPGRGCPRDSTFPMERRWSQARGINGRLEVCLMRLIDRRARAYAPDDTLSSYETEASAAYGFEKPFGMTDLSIVLSLIYCSPNEIERIQSWAVKYWVQLRWITSNGESLASIYIHLLGREGISVTVYFFISNLV